MVLIAETPAHTMSERTIGQRGFTTADRLSNWSSLFLGTIPEGSRCPWTHLGHADTSDPS